MTQKRRHPGVASRASTHLIGQISASVPLNRLTPRNRNRITARLSELDRLEHLVRERPFGRGWTA